MLTFRNIAPWGDRGRVFVVFHGLGGHAPMDGVYRAIENSAPAGGVIIAPQVGTGWVGNLDPREVVRAVIERVEAVAKEHDHITIVGYSAGGVLARELFLTAWGVDRDRPFDVDLQPLGWAKKIDRVVLLAGMNRGWSFAPTSNRLVAMLLHAVYTIFRSLGKSQYLAAFRKGSPFITAIRLQWIALMKRSPDAREAVVVQLLGTIDDIVSPEDNIDVESSQDILYIEVPDSGHANVIDFDEKEIGNEREERFLKALITPRQGLVPPLTADVSMFKLAEDPEVEHVVFVIHGIRDYGFWTSHIAQRLFERGKRENVKVAAATPKYGYFPMLPFIVPATRHRKIEWLMNEYIKALVQYPNAERFSYIGHSNGTYLLAGALNEYAAVHFDSVVFAGSVVRSEYDWPRFIHHRRVRKVLNYVATSDWVVAIFPRFLGRWLGMDIGGAGFDGFSNDRPANIEYIKGRHSAALGDRHWEEIADFVFSETTVKSETSEQSAIVSWLARGAPLIWLAGLALVVGAPFLVYASWVHRSAKPWPWSLWTLVYVVWLSIVRFILVRL